MSTLYKNIVDNLSAAIANELNGLRSEECHPRRDADDMDQYISDQKKRVARLQELREEVEFLAAGYTGNPKSALTSANAVRVM